MNNFPKKPTLLTLCGDHSNYTFEQNDYKTAGREFDFKTIFKTEFY
jgi:hypothetical protein